MFPDSLGPGKYQPMFGGLHIEKLLLEIHGQLIAGSGLARFLDQVKISITGLEMQWSMYPKLLVSIVLILASIVFVR